ncbi:hypothetical protein LPB86_13260 [Pedobacter sp. MC2016-14]|uniref:MutS-related protein n=1 Tax=Pedobacter sp. MC2016-14 TaxID=2897327 RepID=UPI001E367202|nr:hypothetical protein [Pedobacter sp. MC2016-14]MCD0489203.1 hypothetical protein [Pedobacter sp. MC2016-14]
MSFTIDSQTLEDLNVFGKRGRDSIYSLFHRTRTRGGAELLEHFFRFPLDDAEKINARSQTIQYFHDRNIAFPFLPEWFDTAELYLSDYDERSKLRVDNDNIGRKLNHLMGADAHYQSILNGLGAVANIIINLKDFILNLGEEYQTDFFIKEISLLLSSVIDKDMSSFIQQTEKAKLSYAQAAAFDQLIRFNKRDSIKQLLANGYVIDINIAVAEVARKHSFVFPVATQKGSHSLVLKNVYHPLVQNAVGNDLVISPESNIIFLTGANMAGKSTFMKSLGIAVYLAHIGFPVPAKAMEFSVRQGLFTTINLADNLNAGHSHFYAEVLRVKQVSEQLAKNRDLFVIFDELFRGTNVKDAYEATVAVTEAYAMHKNCMFVVSTHIIEAAEELKKRCQNINYVFLPTLMEGNVPRYPYTLKSGVTSDRHGMVIIKNEGILELLDTGKKNIDFTEPQAFVSDKQSLEDLNLLGKYKSKSIFGLFNQTKTQGGERLLEKLFRTPLTDAGQINSQSAVFAFFQAQTLQFPIRENLCLSMENYLKSSSDNGAASLLSQAVYRRGLYLMGMKDEYFYALEGLKNTFSALNDLRIFLTGSWIAESPQPFKAKIDAVKLILENKALNLQTVVDSLSGLTWISAIKQERRLFTLLNSRTAMLLNFIYELDVYLSVGNVARIKGFTRALAKGSHTSTLLLEGAYHPAPENAIANDIQLDGNKNLIFLTGANMAGKSTIMKTVAVCFYLAHMGFPVPARIMEFSVMEGIYTSINVPDNLNMGYSHFYAEVLRVKKVAEEVASGKKLLIIFDELFKGTNVKDAFDATLAVSEGLLAYKNCKFIISTHIVEVGHELMKGQQHIQFKYMPTIMQGHVPHYPYLMAEGISNDRHGMLILKNEGVLEPA